MQLFSLDLSLPILLAAFSLCTSMLAVLGTVQLVVSAPAAVTQGHIQHSHSHSHEPALEVGLEMYKRVTPWWGTISAAGQLHASQIHSVVDADSTSADPNFVPLESRPPLSMAKLIMFRHVRTFCTVTCRSVLTRTLQVATQRRSNARARTRLSQLAH